MDAVDYYLGTLGVLTLAIIVSALIQVTVAVLALGGVTLFLIVAGLFLPS